MHCVTGASLSMARRHWTQVLDNRREHHDRLRNHQKFMDESVATLVTGRDGFRVMHGMREGT